jgi:hypothetical protein
MVGDKILVKADPSMFIEPGRAPSTRQLFNAARGIGSDGGSLGAKGRLAGLAGLAGKGAAAYATAEGIADSMQGGNAYAGLGAQYNMQGLDPTQPLSGYISGGTPPAQAPTSAQVPGTAPPTTSMPVSQFLTGNTVGVRNTPQTHQNVPLPGSQQNVPLPGSVAVQQPQQPQHDSTATASTGATDKLNKLNKLNRLNRLNRLKGLANFGMGGTGPAFNNQTSLGMDPSAMMAAGQQPQQNITHNGQSVQFGMGLKINNNRYKVKHQLINSHIAGMEEYMRNQKNAGEFTDMLYDILGPDNLYKMTPNEIGELAAFMYIKQKI